MTSLIKYRDQKHKRWKIKKTFNVWKIRILLLKQEINITNREKTNNIGIELETGFVFYVIITIILSGNCVIDVNPRPNN